MTQTTKLIILISLVAIALISWEKTLKKLDVSNTNQLFEFVENGLKQQQPTNTETSHKAHSEQPSHPTEIQSVTVVDQNYWETKIQIEYTQAQNLPSGYVTFDMIDIGWHHNVGLVSRPGKHSGAGLLSRHTGRPHKYTSNELRGRIYNPYKHDRDYYTHRFPVDINWPGKEEYFKRQTPDPKFSKIKGVRIFRNIPNYNKFANNLVEAGFAPDIMEMNLAVCGNCTPSLIFGDGVPIAALQTILQTLKNHGYPIDLIEYSSRDTDIGSIQIGQAPGPKAKHSWDKLAQLLTENIDSDEFYALLGFARKSPHEKAIELHAKAKKLIDKNYRNSRIKPALDMLYLAMEIDPEYIPSYIELARYHMRTNRSFREETASEASAIARRILEKSLLINPDFANTYVLLGYAQAIEHDFVKAAESFDKAEELGTTNLWLNSNRAHLFKLQGNDEEAIRQLEKSLSATPNKTDNDRALKFGMDKLARYYLKYHRINEALQIYDRQRREFPHYTAVITRYMRALLAYTHNYDRVGELLAEATKINCYCLNELRVMNELMQASLAVQRGDNAVHHLIKAESSNENINKIIVNISQGGQGRELLDPLLDGPLSIVELERVQSILSQINYLNDSSVLEYLLHHGANPNQPQHQTGYTPLMVAILYGSSESIEILLNYGADPKSEHSQGFNILDLANSRGDVEIIRMIQHAKGVKSL